MKAIKKIKTLQQLVRITGNLRKNGKKIVFTNGCFDILHIGHIRLFEKAKSYGGILVIGINSDSSVRRLKGRCRPVVAQSARAEIIASLENVDYVVIFGEDTPLKTIKALMPDVLIKGADYKHSEIIGREYSAKVVRFPVLKGWSTSSLIKKCAN